MRRPPPRSTLFPYTTLFRSLLRHAKAREVAWERPGGDRVRLEGVVAQERRHAARRGHRRSVRRSEEHTSELQSRQYIVCRLLLEKKMPISRSLSDSLDDIYT